MQAYVSYKVQTKTTLQQYSKKENEVIRRFRDFAWLHTKLQDQNRGRHPTQSNLYPIGLRVAWSRHWTSGCEGLLELSVVCPSKVWCQQSDSRRYGDLSDLRVSDSRTVDCTINRYSKIWCHSSCCSVGGTDAIDVF
jgi:hypothetical protein